MSAVNLVAVFVREQAGPDRPHHQTARRGRRQRPLGHHCQQRQLRRDEVPGGPARRGRPHPEGEGPDGLAAGSAGRGSARQARVSCRRSPTCWASNNINLDNCSGFVANNRAILVIEVHELTQARAMLEQQGLRLLSQEEMLRL